METVMRANEEVTKNICDKNPTNNNFNTLTSIMEQKRCNSCSTTETMTITEAMSTTTITENYETIKGRLELLKKTDSFVCDLSAMSFCCDDETENDNKNPFENESDREQDDENFYDSTHDSDDDESDKTNKQSNEKEALLDSCKEEECGFSKLYLNDIEINAEVAESTLTELVNITVRDKLIQVDKNRSLRAAFGFILRLIFPLANGVVQIIKGVKGLQYLNVIRCIASSRQALTNLISCAADTIFINLSSVPVSLRIEAILKLLKIRKARDGMESLSDYCTKRQGADTFTPPSTPDPTTPTFSPASWQPRYSLPNFRANEKKLSIEDYEAINCCTLNILAEPPSGQPIRADIVFIHGLNGSLANTWKQGLWENDRRPVEFQRPPKPPIRPPKRPRHSRTNAIHPPHHKKRARFSYADVYQTCSYEKDSIEEADENNYSCMSTDAKDLQLSDDVDCSFPTFRLRMHDSGRLLQAEHYSKSQDPKSQDSNRKQKNTVSPEDSNSFNVNQNFDRIPLKSSTNEPPIYSKCWPGDWLPIDCPGVRVVALSYTTDTHLWRPLWKKKEARSNLIQRAREMIELLIKHRVGYGHPIIWVGHSKGGLFIKQIIVDAWESGRPAAAPFWRSARGVFFYSVPHRGSHLASIKPPFFLLRSVELIDIEKNNKYLLDLHRRFAGLYLLGHLKIEVFSFVETAFTLMSVLYMRIVGVDSADPGIGDVCGIRLDHREICKPRSRDCILYKQLVNMINKVC